MITVMVAWALAAAGLWVVFSRRLRQAETDEERREREAWQRAMDLMGHRDFRFQTESDSEATQMFLARGDFASANIIIERAAQLSGIDRE